MTTKPEDFAKAVFMHDAQRAVNEGPNVWGNYYRASVKTGAKSTDNIGNGTPFRKGAYRKSMQDAEAKMQDKLQLYGYDIRTAGKTEHYKDVRFAMLSPPEKVKWIKSHGPRNPDKKDIEAVILSVKNNPLKMHGDN